MKNTFMHDSSFIEMIAGTGDGVYIVDENKNIVRWNKAAETILKYSEPEVLDRKCHAVLAGRSSNDALHCRMDCEIHRASAEEPQKNFSMQTQTKDGDAVWLNISIISSSINGQRFVAHILRNISHEKRMEFVLNRMLSDLGVAGSVPAPLSETMPVCPPFSSATNGRVTDKTPKALSDREIEVLTLLAEGLPTKNLARKLNISHFTARNHIQNILIKLDLHSKAQAVAFAYKTGILKL